MLFRHREKSLFAVTLVDSNDDVVGFAAFYDYPPPVCSIRPSEWPNVLQQEFSAEGLDVSISLLYCVKHQSLKLLFEMPLLQSLNSMFLHLFVTKTDYAVGCAQEIVKLVQLFPLLSIIFSPEVTQRLSRSLYSSVSNAHQVLMCVPVNSHPDPAIADIFKPINRTIKASSTQYATFYVSYRHEVAPVLYVRHAQ